MPSHATLIQGPCTDSPLGMLAIWPSFVFVVMGYSAVKLAGIPMPWVFWVILMYLYASGILLHRPRYKYTFYAQLMRCHLRVSSGRFAPFTELVRTLE